MFVKTICFTFAIKNVIKYVAITIIDNKQQITVNKQQQITIIDNKQQIIISPFPH